jgi:hypothetical protein
MEFSMLQFALLLSVFLIGKGENFREPVIISSGKNFPTPWKATLSIKEHRHEIDYVQFTTM